jgi:V/A-type H+-transporting ATPase subunit F
MVITTPELASGFELAGVETFTAEDGQQAESILRRLLKERDASLIAIDERFMKDINPRLQRQLETSYQPVVMPIPGGAQAVPGEERRRYIASLIRKAIGFHITFGEKAEEAEP